MSAVTAWQVGHGGLCVDSLRMGACVSRNWRRTSWKTGMVAAERDPEDTEPFSSTTSDSPQR